MPYEVRLAKQSSVTFVAKPGKDTLNEDKHAGIVQFRVEKAGTYRVSITSGQLDRHRRRYPARKFEGFSGQRDCKRPQKIVEYELPAGRDLTLQFSGSADAQLIVAITAVSTSAAR
jgi:hypothetical protein